MAVKDSDDRRGRGLRALAEITGGSGQAVVESLRDIAPDLADGSSIFLRRCHGAAGPRSALAQLATIAALTSLGNAQPQLRVHIGGALNVGCEPQEIIEVILQSGIRRISRRDQRLNVAREVFRAR